jgi:L-ascorbate metabolism protein UlaG (beta-lactamase superfamily)
MTDRFGTDRFKTAAGDLEIAFLGHGSLLFTFGSKKIYVDPFTRVADFSELPPADLVLITHEHRDHLDPEALAPITGEQADIVCTALCAETVENGIVLGNGDTREIQGLKIEAVPAYNLKHLRENGEPYHPRGNGNGYIIDFGGLRVYVAGDTENVPEIKSLTGIDVAFLPMNLPYTMTPEMVADVATAVRPRVLYPYHYGSTDVSQLSDLLADQPEIEVRIRDLA